MQSLRDLWRGIVRHPLKFAGYAFTAFSVIYTLIKGLTQFVPGVTIEGPIALGAVVVVCVAYGLKQVWKPSRIELAIAHTNTTLEILFGDLFKQPGIRAISVNEFFDSELGKPVSDKSLHGIFLRNCFGGHPESFDRQVDQQLANVAGSTVDKVEGKNLRYPIGTTALVAINDDTYLLFALSHTDVKSLKASATVTMMWDALHCLWQRARNELGGRDLSVPLVGSGLSGLGLPTRDLLNLIILSAITETKTSEVTRKIRIVLHRDRFEELDLRDVRKHWEEK